jgi:hypothetical protein
MAAIIRMTEAIVAAVATLLARATRARTTSLALPHLLGPLLQSLDGDHQHIPRSGSGGSSNTAFHISRLLWLRLD